MSKEYYLYVSKKKVQVPKAVYYSYMRAEWREAKSEKVRSFMEYSFDALSEQGKEFASNDGAFEELIAYKQILAYLHSAYNELTDDERWLIDALFFQMQTEREVSKEIGVSQKAISKRKGAILQKLRKLLHR